MKRLIVHLGPPNTAAISIQQALYANSDVLATHGVYLPTSGRSELAPNLVTHHQLGWELTGSPRFTEAQGGWQALTDELADVDAETVLLSSEILALAATRGARESLDEHLLSLGRHVTIVYTVRDPLSYINSNYAQQIKAFETTVPFGKFVRMMLSSGEADLEQQTSHWYSATDFDFVAIPFPALTETGPLVALVQAVDLDVPIAELQPSTAALNVTLGPIAVEAFRLLSVYLRGLNPSFSNDDLEVRKLHRVAARSAKGEGWYDEPFWGWTPEQVEDAMDVLRAPNERFSEAVWGTPWPLELPDRPPARTHAFKLSGDELDRVQEFVTAMAKRYIQLRRQTRRKSVN